MLLLLLPLARVAAQISEIEQIFRSHNNDYVQYTSIVRNYDTKYNVLSQYGYFTNEPRADTIKGYSSFVIQNTNTGVIKRIFDLPKGYQVNDVRFVPNAVTTTANSPSKRTSRHNRTVAKTKKPSTKRMAFFLLWRDYSSTTLCVAVPCAQTVLTT